MSADVLVDTQQDYNVDLIGPMHLDKSWQALGENAFDLAPFTLDWEEETATCPNGKQSRYWKPSTGPRGKPTIQVQFDKKDCAACAARTLCTRSRSEPRGLTLHPQAQHLALNDARERQTTKDFRQTYAGRAGVEGTVSQAAFALDMRRTRYRGLPKRICNTWPRLPPLISNDLLIGSWRFPDRKPTSPLLQSWLLLLEFANSIYPERTPIMNRLVCQRLKSFTAALLLCSATFALFGCVPGRLLSPPRDSPLSASPLARTATPPDSLKTTASSTEQLLAQVNVPERDPRDLAIRLRPDVLEVPLVVNAKPPNDAVGDQRNFWVLNVNTLETKQISAELIYKTKVAYAWAEVGASYNRDTIIEAVEQFSTQSYPAIVAFFGSEWNPGVDNDPRLHILHATDVGAGGYFNSPDEYSQLVNPFSNEKEIFYIAFDVSNDGSYGDVLAHEFQHMVHWHHDSNEAAWVDEGLGEYAAEVAGFGTDTAFINEFVRQPDTQLNDWGEGSLNHYGASYLFMKYLHQRFGPTLLRTLVAQPGNGIAGLQQAFAQLGIAQDFDALFADWVIANYANQPDALDQAGRYGYQDFQFDEPYSVRFTSPYRVRPYQATVSNYATDYIRLQGEGDITVNFAGKTTTQLTTAQPYSGSYAWWSHRSDGSDTQLTRLFDLQSVTAGMPVVTEVAMWWEIEEHYDYGYVLASRDGRKWDILQGQLSTAGNPTGNSFGPAYTGANTASNHGAAGWTLEQFDLSAYAGDQIWVRFEYITDDAVTGAGWFIDDIRVPAVNYATDFEHDADGWAGNGWLLTDSRLSQRWLLQVMAFDGDELIDLRRVEVDAAGQAQIEITSLSNRKAAVLAISALAPTTLVGHYEVTISQGGDK